MVSGEKKRTTSLYEKLQLLRSVTKSTAESDTSIIIDASRYIEELKQKVETLNQDIANSSLPTVTVKTLKKGFHVNVSSRRNCPGLLVFILEAFEELSVNVLDARVSCTDKFQLEAVGENQGKVDAEVLEEAMLQAIRVWSESNDQED